MSETVECKVIKILDYKNILIDYGRIDGASEKDVIRIIERGEEIIYDGRNYGTLDNIKAELSIQTIYEKFSLCRNIKRSNSLSRGLSQSIFSIYNYRPADLKVNEDQIEHIEIPDNDVINLGDLVEVIKF